ncbi:MAG: septum formation initiator [Marinilabiliales bacterium]|nr:MAG: septum formation initiator [Marinilabiliales bacterium]
MTKKVWTIVKNKYFLSTTFFLVWITFFDGNNLIHQSQLRAELNKVKKERQFYLDEIEKDSRTYIDIQDNIEDLEKFGREKYLMKRDNEDIFLIVYE